MTATTDTGFEGQDKDLEGQPVLPDPNTTPSTGPAPKVAGTGVHPNDNGGPQAHTEDGVLQPHVDNGGPQAHTEDEPVA